VKVEKKGSTKAELDKVISCLDGVGDEALAGRLAAGPTFEFVFAAAP
jgi:hypothetical protein